MVPQASAKMIQHLEVKQNVKVLAAALSSYQIVSRLKKKEFMAACSQVVGRFWGAFFVLFVPRL